MGSVSAFEYKAGGTMAHTLDTRFKLPWNSFYPLWGEGKGISYPDESLVQ